MKKKLQNFWYYYKVPAIIALIVLAAGIYLLLQHRSVESDYHAAIVSPQSPSADQLERIQKALEGIGQDQNGDGSVVVTLRVFRFAIGENGQGMNEAAALDADLVGNQSGLFFVNDPEKFEKSTNEIGKAADAVPVSGILLFSDCGIDDLYFLVRSGADQRYIEMRSALTEKNIEDKR